MWTAVVPGSTDGAGRRVAAERSDGPAVEGWVAAARGDCNGTTGCGGERSGSSCSGVDDLLSILSIRSSGARRTGDVDCDRLLDDDKSSPT